MMAGATISPILTMSPFTSIFRPGWVVLVPSGDDQAVFRAGGAEGDGAGDEGDDGCRHGGQGSMDAPRRFAEGAAVGSDDSAILTFVEPHAEASLALGDQRFCVMPGHAAEVIDAFLADAAEADLVIAGHGGPVLGAGVGHAYDFKGDVTGDHGCSCTSGQSSRRLRGEAVPWKNGYR